MLQNKPKLKTLIGNLWDTFWSGGISNPITAIEQITYLIFMKRLDEIESRREDKADSIGEEYKTKFSGTYEPYIDESQYKLKDDEGGTYKYEEQQELNEALKKEKEPRPAEELRWRNFKDLPNEKMLEHVRFNVFPFLKKLNGDGTPFAKYMSNAVFVIEKPSLLAEAIESIDKIFEEIEKDAEEGKQAIQDIQGDVYEFLLSEIATAGKNGQFRTPRHIIKLMVELVKPQLNNKIADPACGTGGFLLGAYQYILTNLIRKKDSSKLVVDEDGFERNTNSSEIDKETKEKLDESLYGFDIDTTMVRLGLMNLMMHGIDNPNIEYADSLSKNYSGSGNYDIVLANPPFTGKLDENNISPDLSLDTNATELLFLERIFKMLNTDGKGAVIVPEGVLFGSYKAQKETRKMLLKDCRMEAVISLPAGAFKPYTGVKTAILVFTKVEENSKEWNTEKVWFYGLESDGYSLNDNRRKLKETPLPEVESNFEDRIGKNYENRRKHFFVSLKEIKENDLDLSYNRYKDYEHEEEQYDPPQKILTELIEIEENVLEEINRLKGLIG